MEKNNKISEDIKNLVIWRVRAMGGDMQIHIGNEEKTLSGDEIIDNIKNESNIGRKIIRDQMDYVKAIVSGDIYKLLGNE